MPATAKTDFTAEPEIDLVGEDGNAFAILGRAKRVARRAGWPDERWDEFYEEATSGDYPHLLMTVEDYFTVR